MNPMILGSVLEIGKSLLERWIPDPEKKREAEMELIRMAADGELKQVIAQLEINAREAAHPSIFVAGWRPAIGWICGTALAYQYVVRPIVSWGVIAAGYPLPPMPGLDENLWQLLLGMLGLGGLRTFERVKGVIPSQK